MRLLGLSTFGYRLAVILLVGVAAAGPESSAHAWESLETAFGYDSAAFRNGVLVLPSFGFVVPGGNDSMQNPKTGAHMGTILGRNLSPRFSINGELNLAALRFKASTSNDQTDTGFLFEYGLSPLFHVGAENLEFLLGPKLGRFKYALPDSTYGQPLSGSTGWSYGVNVGVLGPVQTMAIGALISFTNDHATEVCDSTCHGRSSNVGDVQAVTISFAMLY